VAAQYGVASVCIKPYAVKRAVEWLRGTNVLVGCAWSVFRTAMRRRRSNDTRRSWPAEMAPQIDMVLNLGKALSGDWGYVEQEVKAVCGGRTSMAPVKVIFENDYLRAVRGQQRRFQARAVPPLRAAGRTG
jgi:deoxyribose-phosphate aldolase